MKKLKLIVFFALCIVLIISVYGFEERYENSKVNEKLNAVECDAECQASTPGGYVGYDFEHNHFSKFEIIFNWSDTPKVNNVGLYPALLHFWFESDQGGYTGPQIEIFNSGATITKKVIFSIWSMNNQQFTAHPYSSDCMYGDTEGNFVRCMITDYEWIEGKDYKITVERDEELEDGVVWKGTIQDSETNEKRLIGKIKLDDQGSYKGYGLLRRHTGGFFEYYFGSKNKCLEAEYGKIIRKGPYADGRWLARKGTVQSPKCYRSDRTSPEIGVIIEEVGEGVSREVNIPPDQNFETKILWELDHDIDLCIDFDNDGYYPIEGCGTDVDCDDENDLINPDAVEVCDNIDNDCNNKIDEDLSRAHSNQKGLCTGNQEVCDAGEWINAPSFYEPVDETDGDGKDNDCDGIIDNQCEIANLNKDNTVNIFDLLELLKILKQDTPSGADINLDGRTNIFDLIKLLNIISFGDCGPTSLAAECTSTCEDSKVKTGTKTFLTSTLNWGPCNVDCVDNTSDDNKIVMSFTKPQKTNPF